LLAEMEHSRPILLFDNDCGICSKFARLVMRGSKNWVETVGLTTSRGLKIKNNFFEARDRPDEMFWLLIGDTGFGGRCGLLPLAREIVRGRIL
jgi:predicted DCC family thiol-disulfide oxidoreductase YuxK